MKIEFVEVTLKFSLSSWYHVKFGPDLFGLFDVYWKQTDRQTNRQTDKQSIYV